jgi:hypothetical protein
MWKIFSGLLLCSLPISNAFIGSAIITSVVTAQVGAQSTPVGQSGALTTQQQHDAYLTDDNVPGTDDEVDWEQVGDQFVEQWEEEWEEMQADLACTDIEAEDTDVWDNFPSPSQNLASSAKFRNFKRNNFGKNAPQLTVHRRGKETSKPKTSATKPQSLRPKQQKNAGQQTSSRSLGEAVPPVALTKRKAAAQPYFPPKFAFLASLRSGRIIGSTPDNVEEESVHIIHTWFDLPETTTTSPVPAPTADLEDITESIAELIESVTPTTSSPTDTPTSDPVSVPVVQAPAAPTVPTTSQIVVVPTPTATTPIVATPTAPTLPVVQPQAVQNPSQYLVIPPPSLAPQPQIIALPVANPLNSPVASQVLVLPVGNAAPTANAVPQVVALPQTTPVQNVATNPSQVLVLPTTTQTNNVVPAVPTSQTSEVDSAVPTVPAV